MRFIIKGQSVHCIRGEQSFGSDTQTERQQQEHVVTTFDSRVDCVPPHVAAALLPEETAQLELWIKDRRMLHKKLKKQSIDTTILEALPGVLRAAKNSLSLTSSLDEELSSEIYKELIEVKKLLEDFDELVQKNSIEVEKMDSSEVLAEQLSVIKKNIDRIERL